VISIIAILAGLLLPAVTSMRERGNRMQCGNNQKQLAFMIVSYIDEFKQGHPWGVNAERTAGVDSGTGAEALAVRTVAAMAQLANAYENDLSNKIFGCPSAGITPGRSIPPENLAAAASDPAVTDIASYDQAWGVESGAITVAFAYDWTAPTSSMGAKRVMLGDRTITNHGEEGANLVYGDTHFEFKTAETDVDGNALTTIGSGQEVLTLQGYVAADTTGYVVYNDEVNRLGDDTTDGDNVYKADQGEGNDAVASGTNYSVGRGDKQYSFLK
jgi:type II secretory pathway pseudopilin PulG